MLTDQLPVESNVRITVRRDDRVLDVRESHNVLTNTGRRWLAQLVGSSNYANPNNLPAHNTEKIMYMGLGCGGALQTDVRFSRFQSALVTVTALEDQVKFNQDNGLFYLKKVNNQVLGNTYFPGYPNGSITKFVMELAESNLAFQGNTAYRSNTAVNTQVPISEAGLYLSGAQTQPQVPSVDNRLVCYDVFSPIIVTPNVTLKIEWELRF